MLKTIIIKEIREKLQSLSFQLTFLVAAILISISIFAGYQVYQTEVDWYEAGQRTTAEALSNKGSYLLMLREGNRVMRTPTKLSIFARGVDSVTGKAALVSENPVIPLIDSRFGQNPVFALFGELDLNFIVTIILSLFAILFSYNSISGERETGTLKQIFSTHVSRARFLLGKAAGGYLTLALSYVIPLLFSLVLLIMLFGIDFTLSEYASLSMMVFIHLLYLAVFYCIGLLMSALSRHSLISLLFSLFAWVLFVAVLPRVAIELASSISPPPSVEELEKAVSAKRLASLSSAKDDVDKYIKSLINKHVDFPKFIAKKKEIENASKEILFTDLAELYSEYQRKQSRLITTAESLSRLSPLASVIIPTTLLTGTDVHLISRLQASITSYRDDFSNYSKDMIAQHPDQSRADGVAFGMSFTDNTGQILKSGQALSPDRQIDISGMPRFSFEADTASTYVEDVLLDIGLLALETIFIYFVAFVRFVRYDIR